MLTLAMERFSPLLIGDRFEAGQGDRGQAMKTTRFSPLLIGDRFEAVLRIGQVVR